MLETSSERNDRPMTTQEKINFYNEGGRTFLAEMKILTISVYIFYPTNGNFIILPFFINLPHHNLLHEYVKDTENSPYILK